MLVVTPFAALAVRDRGAEVVLIFDLLTIFGLLLPLQLQEAGGSPITVMGVAGSSLVTRGTTVKKIGNPLPLEGGGGLLHVLPLPLTALTLVRVRLRRPPSWIPLG